jgi:hypothetical protein
MSDGKHVAMKIVHEGKVREVTVEQLVVSNQLSQEALISLLVKKKLIDPKELLDEIERIRKQRYRAGEPDGSGGG